MRLMDYLDPQNIGGFVKQGIDAHQDWGQRLYDTAKPWQDLTFAERVAALAEAGVATGADMLTASAAGFNGIARLMETGSLEEAVDMINSTMRAGPSYDPVTPGGQTAVNTMGVLAEPVDAAIQGAGDAVFAATESPAAGAGTIAFSSFIGPRSTRGMSTGEVDNVRRRLDEGESNEKIRQETGWYQDPVDGQLKFEIDDSEAEIIFSPKGEDAYEGGQRMLINDKGDPDDGTTTNLDFGQNEKDQAKLAMDTDGKWRLGEMLKHDKLFEQYPALKDVEVVTTDKLPRGEAGFHPGEGRIYVNRHDWLKGSRRVYADDRKKSLLHEVQHIIQNHEDFAGGGNPNSAWMLLDRKGDYEREKIFSNRDFDFENISDKDRATLESSGAARRLAEKVRKGVRDEDSDTVRRVTYDAYQLLGGEAEARNVENRMNMSPRDRLENPPWATMTKTDVESLLEIPLRPDDVFDSRLEQGFIDLTRSRGEDAILPSAGSPMLSKKPGKPKNRPEIERAQSALRNGLITKGEYDQIVNETIRPYSDVPLPASYDDMYGALMSNKRDKINTPVGDGEPVGLRLDIPAYEQNGVWVPTLHRKGAPTSHRATAAISNANLEMPENLRKKAQKIREEGAPKSPFARMEGGFINRSDEDNFAIAKEALGSKEWTQIGYDPRRKDYFYDRDSGREVLGADEVVQVGPLVLGKNTKFRDDDGGMMMSSKPPKPSDSKHKTKRVRDREGNMVGRPGRMTEVPDLRGLPVEDALDIARYEPHLISGGEGTKGAYVGGPRNIKSRRALTEQRRRFDEVIDQGAEGGDWYDRYRAGVASVVDQPGDATWMSNLEAQYSAGVDPGSELAFSLKDTNSAIANGSPVKPARPAQQQASIRAIEANDPTLFQLGKKTGKYGRLVNPEVDHVPGATGVNDFRHFRNLGFTEVTGEKQRAGVGDSGHKFADYETALAVSRARDRNAAGRDDWTGEQVQAAAWVKQKADDIFEMRKNSFMKRAEEIAKKDGRNEPIETIARELAFKEANKTIADFFPKHTAFATHEPQPYVGAGQLPRLADASPEEKMAFAQDPRSRWDFAPGGRDAIYSGMRLGDTGYAMRVLPTNEMRGVYDPPGSPREYNPGYVARPLIAFDSGKTKSIPEADRSLLDAGEATRAYLDVQGAGAYHKPWVGGQTGQSNAMTVRAADRGAASTEEMRIAGEIGERYGLPDVIDTGQGFTLNRFFPDPDPKSKAEMGRLADELMEAFPGAEEASRAKVDGGYLSMFEEAGDAGSGGATRALMEVLDNVPESTRNALDNNRYIPMAAADRLERDAELQSRYGTNREDIQRARKIIAEGPGWIGRLKKALQDGAILPATAVAVFAASQDENERESL